MSAAPRDEEHYDDGFSDKDKKVPAKINTWQDFENELHQREHAIASMLPSNVNRERFKNTAIAAVKQNPELLECTPRSLFQAITRSAQDGILPDGREGVIGTYNTKVKKRGQEVWEKHASWNPMTFGLRKRARELDGLLIDAQVVHEKDLFKQVQGDDPKIIHEPPPLGTDRGKMVGAYAIFKREDKTILAREVMDFRAIETVREQSKQPDGLMWKKFTSEAWRKTVARRAFKSVPVSENLQAIIQRDDEANFDFDQRHETVTLTPPPAPPPAPKPLTHAPGQTMPAAPPQAPETVPVDAAQKPVQPRRKAGKPRGPAVAKDTAPEPRTAASIAAEELGGPRPEEGPALESRDSLSEWLEDQVRDAQRDNLAALERRDDEVCRELDGADREDLRERWNEVYADRKAELKQKK